MRKISSPPHRLKLKRKPRARFDGGTIVIDNVPQGVDAPAQFRWLQGKWRCRAVDYRIVRPWLDERKICNHIPRWHTLSLQLQNNFEPHPYQTEALNVWIAANRWGSVVLPTGRVNRFSFTRYRTDTSEYSCRRTND